MEVYRRSSWLLLLLGITFLAVTLQGVQGEAESEGPSESECRPYIEKALKELATEDAGEHLETPGGGDSAEDVPTVEITTDDSDHPEGGDGDNDSNDDGKESAESVEHSTDNEKNNDQSAEDTDKSKEGDNAESTEQTGDASVEDNIASGEQTDESEDNKENDSVEETQSVEEAAASKEDDDAESGNVNNESIEDDTKSKEDDDKSDDNTAEDTTRSAEDDNKSGEDDAKSAEDTKSADDETESADADAKSAEDDGKSTEDNEKSTEDGGKSAEDATKSAEEDDTNSVERDTGSKEDDDKSVENTKSGEDTDSAEGDNKSDDNDAKSGEGDTESAEDKTGSAGDETKSGEDDADSKQDEEKSVENEDKSVEKTDKQDTPKESPKMTQDDAKGDDDAGNEVSKEDKTESDEEDSGENKSDEPVPEEELTKEIDIPTELRPRDHIDQLLKLDDEHLETEKIINRVAEITLRELKRLYENAIKPLEVLYKYRDLSNRHFGDPEIFAKPLVLFMGPWSGGKSSIINYLLDNEYNDTSLRTGAEPSPAYFNILMHGEEAEILEGTQLAADYTFSGLQKFGQGLEERLRGLKLPRKLLEKINIVEIPGILEVRKQVSRLFPFNDACQWFIDRADIIFLVYDPSKLDVGPETEAILDQLKGREHQTRIILNKADQVKPEELMRVQGALIWNISPLMSSAQPPIMYTTSLWSRPYEAWAPVRLLQAQERAFLRDLRSAVDKRIENKIASARRFAVRVRNHAKMVDCYLTTYYNHKSVFGNKKQVADEITEHPQDYHIYEGISTLTNISRYDLPDPDVYRDFFKLNPLYDFQQLSATCTYFRGCPINRLDVAIAYDLPELVGKHRRLVENALAEANLSQTPDS